MQQGHLTVLLLKIRAPAIFAICVLCLGGSQDPSYVLCRATTARKDMLLPSLTWWWSSIRMHPNHSDHLFLPQVIAVSCDNSEVPANTWKAYTDRKNAFFFQADWLSNQTHHTYNPIPVPTQNTAQNYTEPAWVKQIWNHTHRKYTTNSNSFHNWTLAKLPNNYVYSTLYIWEADIRLLISKLRHMIHLYKVSRVQGKGLKTPLKHEHLSSWLSFYSKFHGILHFRFTTAVFKDLQRLVVISVFNLKTFYLVHSWTTTDSSINHSPRLSTSIIGNRQNAADVRAFLKVSVEIVLFPITYFHHLKGLSQVLKPVCISWVKTLHSSHHMQDSRDQMGTPTSQVGTSGAFCK